MSNTKRNILLIIETVVVFIAALLLGCILIYDYASEKIAIIEADRQFTYDKMMEYEMELTETYKHISTLNEDFISEQNKNAQLQEKLDAMDQILSDLKSEECELVYIGSYKLTHYCCEKRKHICGTGAGITATGTQVTAGRTIAVDPSVIPYGTEVYIEGYGWRVAEDCGGAVKGKHIDIAVETHSQALSIGTTSGGVWVLVRKDS